VIASGCGYLPPESEVRIHGSKSRPNSNEYLVITEYGIVQYAIFMQPPLKRYLDTRLLFYLCDTETRTVDLLAIVESSTGWRLNYDNWLVAWSDTSALLKISQDKRRRYFELLFRGGWRELPTAPTQPADDKDLRQDSDRRLHVQKRSDTHYVERIHPPVREAVVGFELGLPVGPDQFLPLFIVDTFSARIYPIPAEPEARAFSPETD
jgi:hypothetical protein